MNLLTPQIYTSSGLTKKNILENKRVLDIGCGNRKLPGATGIDIVKSPQVDILHDLSQFPWPIQDNEFEVLFLSHALEHMEDLLKTMAEIHRISRAGARVIIQVPYFRSTDAYTDPTHRHFFTSQSLDYFIQGTECSEYNYVPVRFKRIGFWYGWPHPSRNLLRNLIKNLARRFPRFYDQYFSLFLPVECLTWELEVLK